MTDEAYEEARRPQEIILHVRHHFDPQVTDAISKIAAALAGDPRPAVAARLSVGERSIMPPTTITVDTVNEVAVLQFVDDKGDTNASAPTGALVTFTSDNEAALTIAPDATNGLQGDITVVGEGVANVGATITDADGNPLLEADGVTPWPAIDSVAVTVDPGAAVGAQLSVNPSAG